MCHRSHQRHPSLSSAGQCQRGNAQRRYQHQSSQPDGSRYRQLTDSHRNTDQHNQHADHYQAHTAAQWYGNINEPSCISRKNQRAKTYMNRRETDGHKQLRHSQQLLLILLQLRHSQQQLLILLQLRNTAAGSKPLSPRAITDITDNTDSTITKYFAQFKHQHFCKRVPLCLNHK